MASGFGAKGSEGRCYPLWQGFSKVRFRRRTFLLEQQEEQEEEEECTRVFPFDESVDVIPLCVSSNHHHRFFGEGGFFSSERVSFCFLLLLLRGTPRARKSDEGNESCFRVRETIFRRRFLLRRFLRGTFLPPRRRDGDETRIRETIGLTPLFFFSTKTHCIIIIIIKRQQRKHNSACRRRRTRRNAKTFERTTWSVCITKKSFNARTRSKRKRTDNAGKKRRRYGPRSRNTSTIRAGER